MNADGSRLSRRLTRLAVRPLPGPDRRGVLMAGGLAIPCVLGRGGIVAGKREGDGGTPCGRLPLRAVLQRPGRGPRLPVLLPHRFTGARDAWCDDPAAPRYNTPIQVDGAAEERLWRADALYDVVVPLGWNDGPVRRGRGSAIFWHLARPERTPTAGCVAMDGAVFRRLLPRLARHTIMVVGEMPRRLPMEGVTRPKRSPRGHTESPGIPAEQGVALCPRSRIATPRRPG